MGQCCETEKKSVFLSRSGNSNIKKKLNKCRQAKKQVQAQKDVLYEKYARNELPPAEYQNNLRELTERLSSLAVLEKEAAGKLAGLEEEYRKTEEDMKRIIRYSHIEVLTQEIVDTFIKKVYAYKDKRVEIEWNFSVDTGSGQAKII